MNLIITNQEERVVIKVEGRVDTTTAKEFEAEVKKVIEANCIDIVVDCSELSYVSSSGLRVFLILQKGVKRKNGKLTIVNMTPAIKEIFKITGFISIFDIK